MMRHVCRAGLALALIGSTVACSGSSDGAGTTAEAPKAPASGSQAAESIPGLPAGPIAKVNGTEVSRVEFEQKYAKMTKAFTTRKKDIPENLAKRYKESILKQLIEKELLKQKISKEAVAIEAVELDKEFEEYKKMFRTEENFERYLKSSEVDVEQIKENIRHNIGVNKLLEKSGSIAVAEDESKAYYEENKKRYEIQEQIHAFHILVKLDAKADKKAEADALKKANDLHKEVTKKGADFAAIATKSSDGPTANRGGDLNWFPRGRMVKEFEDIAFKMKAGEISKPVKTQFGYHIIKLIDHKDGSQRPFEEVRESIEKLLKNKKQRKAKQDLLKGLRTEAKLETFIPEAEAAANSIGAEEEKPTIAPGSPIAPISGGLPGPAGLNLPQLQINPAALERKEPAEAAAPAAPASH